MVDHFTGPAPSAQACIRLRQAAPAQPSLVCKLDVKASDARDRARNMPLGEERAAAMQEAMILQNAVEMLRHFGTRAS
jgi:hypothetical protein